MINKEPLATTKIWICLVMMLALGLRMYGIHHGYPYSYYPDESHFVKRALSFGSFDFNPHWFHKPAFYMYVLFFEYGIYFVVGKIIGLWNSTADFAVSYIVNPGPFYLIGRVTTVFFSLGSIWTVFKIGERHFNRGVGVVAALFLSLTFGHISASQDIKADTPTMFFTIASMLFLLNYVNEGKKKFLLWSTIAAGVGVATKTYSILMLPPIMIGIFLVYQKKITETRLLIRKVILDACLVIIVFYLVYFICSPYNFIDPLGRKATFRRFYGLFAKVSYFFGAEKIERPGDFIGEKTSFLGGVIDYMKVFFGANGMGMLIGILSGLGIVLTFRKLNKKSLLLLIYPLFIGFISVFTAPGYAEPRHQLPLYPFLAIFGGIIVIHFAGNKRLRQRIVFAALLVSLLFPLYNILKRGHHISKPDTRNMAKAWIEDNAPSETKILLDENGVQLLSNKSSLEKEISKASLSDPKGQFTAHYGTYLNYQLLAARRAVTYDIEYIRFPWWQESFEDERPTELTSEYDKDMANPLRPVGVNTYDSYVANGFQYVVVQSDKYQRFIKEHSKKKEKFPAFARFYTTLFEKGVLVKEFSPLEDGLSGPTVKIFRIGRKSN